MNWLLGLDQERSLPRARNLAAQLWAFGHRMEPGDLVVLPLKTAPGYIALGRVTGPYTYREIGGEARHTRPVKWERQVPRSVFQRDLLYSFGAFMTVCQITRNDAAKRVLAVLEKGVDPGLETPSPEGGEEYDIAQAAHDEIVQYIGTKFAGHGLARLVAAVLEAEGFQTKISPPGPDRGVDILAARGALGFDEPLLCVQVKTTADPADVTVLRALQGTMASYGATHGLLVSWNGFTEAARREARQLAFKIALWDQTDVVQAVYRTYERLSPEIQAELPLKRIWVLVKEELAG
ncbi:MAG: restriction endonuclease [Candidatus Bipolaricaulota bacterium]|nr:restriction endonuclease [Candidatus Bipolaricaulota bacterium]